MQLLELVSGGYQKSWRYIPPTVDFDQQANGPWSTPYCLVKVAPLVFFVQQGVMESLEDRRLALCWSPWAVGDTVQSGGGKRPGKKPRASEAWTRILQQGSQLRSKPNSCAE